MKLKARYSGKKSEKFWKHVWKLKAKPWDEVYGLGVDLQNLEGEVLRKLKKALKKQKAKEETWKVN